MNSQFDLIPPFFAGYPRAQECGQVRDHQHVRDGANRQSCPSLHELLRESHPLRLSVGELPQGVPQGDLLRTEPQSFARSHQRSSRPGEVCSHQDDPHKRHIMRSRECEYTEFWRSSCT